MMAVEGLAAAAAFGAAFGPALLGFFVWPAAARLRHSRINAIRGIIHLSYEVK
jgi:hypothetical protein